MARAMWKGAISFGLVNIPVELQVAVRSQRPRFHLLHGKDDAPVKYQRVCTREDREVPWPEIVKGFEIDKGEFVVLDKKDFERAALDKSRTIDIHTFVAESDIDERYFDTPYYLVPDRGGERAYALLREAIRDAGKVGIAQFILRDRQHVATLATVGDALVLTTLRFADELVDIGQLSFPSAKQVRDMVISRVPLKSASSADDIAQVVCFLALPQSGQMTGEFVRMDAGMHLIQ